MISASGTVLRITSSRVDEPFSVRIISDKTVKKCVWRVTDSECRECDTGAAFAAEFSGKFDAEPWSIATPVLYTLTVKVEYEGGECEELSDRFGYRCILAEGKNFYLNGFPFYMRAYIRGAAAHEHQNNCGLSEYDFYKKNITMAKSYGYNTIRFHSVIPPEECFKAADELGIMIHIEMRRENDDYKNLEEMLYGKNDFVTDDRLMEIINSLYNHPSFMVYCIGNEIREPGKKQRVAEIAKIIKREDKTRLFIDTCAHGEYDRDYVDFDVQHMSYFFPYGHRANMFYDTDNLLGFGTVRDIDMRSESEGSVIKRGIAFERPLVAHEVCHYTSWRDYYALRDKFKSFGKEAPWWVEEEIKLLEAKGYRDSFKKTLQITKDFQFRCWKTALENLRASELLSGFHMLQFADTDKYENSNGVVDCFDDPHGISPEEFRKFNSDTVLLARLPKQIYTSSENVRIPVLLSQYTINPPTRADFSYTLSSDEGVVRAGSLASVDTEKCGLYEICNITVTLPECKRAEKLILDCRLAYCDGTESTNSWEIWIFPKCELPVKLDARSDMREDYLNRAVSFDTGSDLVITDKLDDTLFRRLDDGEDVILIYRTDWCRHLLHKDMDAPKYSFRHVWERYKGVIWDRGTINGGADDKDLLNKYGFVTDGQINYQYYHLIDDSDKITLDDFPVKVKSLVSGIDKASRDRFDVSKFEMSELTKDRTMRNFSYAFSLGVGKGRLLVTGFNFTGVKDFEPATISMLKTLVSYARSEDFAGGDVISTHELKSYLSSIAAEGPQKEGMMTQYWQLDAEPVESMDYWRESERYLREAPERTIERY